MHENLSPYLSLTFGLTTATTLILFVRTIRNSTSATTRKKSVLIFIGLAIWLGIQAILSLNDIYNMDMASFPPKLLLLGIMPAMLTIVLLFSTSNGRHFIDSLSLRRLCYLHVVRVPVEIVLFWLFLDKAVPELMTFEGSNLDILSGITAPIIAYYGFTKQMISRKIILIWNFVCLGLLINIVVIALFAAPTPIQKFAFEQPNIAIFHFPIVWLPTFIVPIVLLAHASSIRQLWKQKTTG